MSKAKKVEAWKKVRKFVMTGESKDNNRTMDLWRLSHGYDENTYPCLTRLMTIVGGDLVIANRIGAIASLQKFSIDCVIHAKNATGIKVKIDFRLSVDKKMTIAQFLNGAKEGEEPILIEENGEMVEFLGANHLMESYLKEVAGEDFNIYEQPYHLWCHSAFKDRFVYREFCEKKAFIGTQVKVAA